jgi:hypothetical protein
MLKLKYVWLIALVMCLMLGSCSNSPAISQTTTTFNPEITLTSVVSDTPDPVEAYLVVIDHLLENRRIASTTRKYLSIDTSKLPDFSSLANIQRIKS